MEKKKISPVLTVIAFIVIIFAFFYLSKDDKEDNNQKPSFTATYEEGSNQYDIQTYIADHISKEYSDSSITEITINEDASSDGAGSYIALVHITWNVENSGSTSKDMLDMYSNDLAAVLASNKSNVSELTIFWTVPYLNAEAKYSFERRDNGMYPTDQLFTPAAAFN